MAGLKDKLKRATNSVASAAANVADKANQVAKTTMTSLTDLNGDGKIDSEDLKIALDKAKEIGGNIAEETGKLAKGATDHPMVKDAAAGAIVGGAIASFIPFAGTATGAAVGAVVGVITGRNRTIIEVGNRNFDHLTTVDASIPKKRAPRKTAAKKPATKVKVTTAKKTAKSSTKG